MHIICKMHYLENYEYVCTLYVVLCVCGQVDWEIILKIIALDAYLKQILSKKDVITTN